MIEISISYTQGIIRFYYIQRSLCLTHHQCEQVVNTAGKLVTYLIAHKLIRVPFWFIIFHKASLRSPVVAGREFLDRFALITNCLEFRCKPGRPALSITNVQGLNTTVITCSYHVRTVPADTDKAENSIKFLNKFSTLVSIELQ